MTQNKTKANSNQQFESDIANWLSWEIKDFAYQVEVFKKCGRTTDNCIYPLRENQNDITEVKSLFP